MAETEVTRMSSDYADNELELFRKTVSYIHSRKSLQILPVIFKMVAKRSKEVNHETPTECCTAQEVLVFTHKT